MQAKPDGRLRRWGLCTLATLVVILGLTRLSAFFVAPPRILALLDTAVAPLRLVNGYGLFAVMTTHRQEIVIEGSDDDVTWKEYAFRDKPGDVKRAPRFIAPFQPRLDWQMWFAALGDAEQTPWFGDLMIRLLQGSRPVLALLKENPFPDAPPKYVRAIAYVYRFTTLDERRKDGAWWKRQMKVEYYPPTSLSSLTGGAR